MPEIVIQSKIVIPRLHEKIVHRGRLTNLLAENIKKNLIVVCAPAGFGKTILVLDYLQPFKTKCAWFSVPQSGINDASTFFEYLVNSLRQINRDFGSNTLESMKSYLQNPQMLKDMVPSLTVTFINEFHRHFKDDIVLAIDDLHYVESGKSAQWLNQFFGELLKNIPPNLHILIATRTMPGFDMSALKAKRNICVITEKELTFDTNETAELIESLYKYKYTGDDLTLLGKNLKGWVTGIHLFLQAYGEDFNKVKYTGTVAFENIFEFFAREIFERLSPEIQEFLMVTSLIENFDAKLSDAVLGTGNGNEIINEIFRKNLFIQQLRSLQSNGNNGTTFYSYHALFRNFLNQRLKKSRLDGDIKTLKEKIGDYYINASDEVSAINYYLEAENYEKAVPMIVKNFQDVNNAGKYDILLRWFNFIPENILNENAELLYQEGHYNFWIIADYEKASRYIDKALELFHNAGNEDYLVKCWTVKSRLLYNCGEFEGTETALEELISRKLKPKNEVKISRHLSYAYAETRQFKKAEDLLERAIELCEKHGLNKSGVYHELGVVYFYQKHNEKALFYSFKSLERKENLYDVTLDHCNIATAYSSMGDYGNAIRYYDKTFQMLENSYSRELAFAAYSQKAFLLRRLGDFEESTRLLENIYIDQEKHNIILHLWYVTDYLFRNYYSLNDYNNCLKYLNLQRTYTEALNTDFYKNFLLGREAIFSMKFELHPSAEKKLLDAHNYFVSSKNRYVHRISIHLSDYYLRINNSEFALRYLMSFLKDSDFSALDITDSRNVIDFALSRPELAPFKDKIHNAFKEFFDRPNIEGTSDEYKEKMRIQIENLYDIKMLSFGNLEFISRGVPVPESNWQRKKGKSILAYMMLNPGAKYSRDKLIDMFYPHTKFDTIGENLRQAVFNIRSAIKLPYLNILLSEGNLLYLNPDCYFKSDAVEFDKNFCIAQKSDKTADEKIAACKEAIELYRGEFLAGNYETWCEDIRDTYHQRFISVSELQLSLLKERKDYEQVIHYSENLLKYDKLNDDGYTSLIEAYVSTGKTKFARDTYTRMLRIYQQELDDKPNSRVLTRIQNLLAS